MWVVTNQSIPHVLFRRRRCRMVASFQWSLASSSQGPNRAPASRYSECHNAKSRIFLLQPNSRQCDCPRLFSTSPTSSRSGSSREITRSPVHTNVKTLAAIVRAPGARGTLEKILSGELALSHKLKSLEFRYHCAPERWWALRVCRVISSDHYAKCQFSSG